MNRYDSVLDDSLNYGKTDSRNKRASGPKRLLDTPSPGILRNSRTQPNGGITATSKGTEFTPMLHTIKKSHKHDTPPISKPIPVRGRPGSLLNYRHDVENNASSMISFGGSSSFGGDQDSTPVPGGGAKQRAMVTEDPNGIPLREQARHVEALDQENTDLKLKLQLMSKKLISLSRGKPLSDINDSADLEYLQAKYDDLQSRFDKLKESNTQEDYSTRISELQSDLEDRERQLSQYSEKIDQYENKIDELKGKLEQLEQEDDNSNTSEQNSSKYIRELKEKIEDLEYESRQANEELEKAEEDNARLKEQLDNENAYSDEINDLREENEDLRQELSKYHDVEAQLKEYQDQLEDTQNQLERAREELQTRTTNRSRAADLSVNGAEVTNANISATMRDLRFEYEEKNRALQQEVEILRDQLQTNKNDLAGAEKEARDYRIEISLVKEEVAAANALVRRLQNESAGAQKEKDYYENQFEEAQAKVLKFSKMANESMVARHEGEEIERLRQELDEAHSDYQRQNSKWDDERATFSAKIRSLERLKESAERQMDSLLSTEKRSSHLKDVLDTEREKFQSEKEMLQSEIKGLKQQNKVSTEEQESINKKYTDLKEQLEKRIKLHDAAIKEAASSKSQQKQLESQVQQQQREAFKLQSEIDSQKVTIDMLRELEAATKEKLLHLENKLADAVKQVDIAENALRDAERKMGHLESKLDHSESKAIDADQTRIETENEVNDVLDKLHLAQNHKVLLEKKVENAEQERERLELKLHRAEAQIERLISQGSNHNIQRTVRQEEASDTSKLYKKKYERERIYADNLKAQLDDLEEKMHPESRLVESTKALSTDKEARYKSMLKLYGNYVKFNKLHSRRELAFKEDLELTKDYLMAKSGKFLESNITTLSLFADIGLYPNYHQLATQKRTFRAVAYTVLATVLFQKRLDEYREYQHAYKKVQHMRELLRE